MLRLGLLAFLLLVASKALAAFELKPGETATFRVEIPAELRKLAEESGAKDLTVARVAVALPPDFSPDRAWPVMVISATAAPRHYASNTRLLGFYAPVATAAGWVLVATDPEPDITAAQDTDAVRLALLETAFAALATRWPQVKTSPLAFGGFSGGAKRSGTLAALYRRLFDRQAIGVFQAGINEETVALMARDYGVRDARHQAMPVFLLAGTQDEIATPEQHRQVQRELKRAGFKQVKLETFPGPHAVDPRPLQRALAWFKEVAAAAAEKKE